MSKAKPSKLIKFCDINTALKILNSQSLRWSAPHLYNDPFELNHQSDTDFTAQQLLQGITKEALAVLFGGAEPTGNNELVQALKRWQYEGRFDNEQEAETVLKQLVLPIAQQQQKAVNQYLQDWQSYAKNIRVCCFSNHVKNTACWQRYAQEHHGIALAFDSNENSLQNAKPVSYAEHPISATSLKEQIDIAFGRSTAPSKDDFGTLLLHKPAAEQAEQEWRCLELEDKEALSDEQLWYKAKPFETEHLTALYFGLNTTDSDKIMLKNLVAKAYPHCRIYQSELPNNSYNLAFYDYS